MAPHRHFLLVDDDAVLCAMLAEQLHDCLACSVDAVGSLGQARLALARRRFDAVLLDVNLPDGDGRELCHSWRRQGLNLPILLLTGAANEADVVRGLDAGANDYVTKPFRMAELVARLRAQLRTFETSEYAEIAVGPYVFRPGLRQLQAAGARRPVRLTEKEAAVLKFLYRAQGEPVARDVLLHEVWGYSADTSTHTVETHIYRLRRKIESVPGTERLLVNQGGGYRLCLDAVPPPPATGRGTRLTRTVGMGDVVQLACVAG